MPTVILTPKSVLQYFLYDKDATPTDLLDQNLIRPSGYVRPVDIDVVDYMQSGAGRFAFASLCPLVQAFFQSGPGLTPGGEGFGDTAQNGMFRLSFAGAAEMWIAGSNPAMATWRRGG